MGIDCSRPTSSRREYAQLYFPTDALRICHPFPSHCRCPTGFSRNHREPRYFYVERGGDGVERFHDPFVYLDRVLGPCGFAAHRSGGGVDLSMVVPWRGVRAWTRRDYERFVEVVMGWCCSRGVGGVGGGDGGMMMMGSDEFAGIAGAGSRMYGRRGPGGTVSGSRCERLRHEERLREVEQLVEERAIYFDRVVNDLSDAVLGSPAERTADQYRARQFKMFQEMFKEVMGDNAFGVPIWNVVHPYRAGHGGMSQQQQQPGGRMEDYREDFFEDGGYGGRPLNRRARFRGAGRRRVRPGAREEEDYFWD